MSDWFSNADPAVILLASTFVGLIVLAAAKLIWGITQWASPSPHMLGQRWGGERGEVAEWADGHGYVRVGGELWRAVSKEKIAVGDAVSVARMKGLTLEIRKDQGR